MRKATLVPLLALVAGCGAPISSQNGAAACIAASACNLLIGSTSACSQAVANINDPQFGLLLAVEFGAPLVKITAAQVNCLAGAGADCTKAKACLDNGMTPAACTGNSNSCMGSAIVSCGPATGSNGNNGQSIFDCATLGPGYSCVASNGTVDCGTASCGGGNPTQCMGNIIQRCNNGILQQVDCSQFSGTCIATGIDAHCRGKGNSCQTQDPGGTLRCDGNTLVVCSDGQEARYDCGRLGLGCFANTNGQAGFACKSGSDCDPGSFTSTCSGNTLTFCNKGKIDTFNCGSGGFTGCNAGAGTCTKS